MKHLLLLTYLIITSAAFTQTYEVEQVELVATIQTINGINQKTEEFSPIAVGDKLYFTSSRQYNKHNTGEKMDKNSYFNIFYGKIRNDEEGVIDIKDIKLLSNKLNTGSHTGPASFSSTGDSLFFTRIEEIVNGSERVYRAQLYSAIKKNNKWGKVRKLPFSTDESSYAHPAYDIIKNRIYFTSDRAGGKGGNDIYYSALINGEWGDPVNVESVNTANSEKFPFVIGGNIFFSSDREGGAGQMDIYYNSPERTDYPIKLAGLNSAYDDFGISILPDLSAGYYTSNRNGNDDIFYFTLERKITVTNSLAGSFTFRSLAGSANNLTVILYDEDGEFILEKKTDDNGYFIFENIQLDSNFTVKLGNLPGDELTLDFYNADGEANSSFILSEEGALKYKKLFYESGGIINFIPDDMKDIDNNTATLSGKLVLDDDPPNVVLSDRTILLLDENEEIVYRGTTDELGNFEFKGLDLDGEYYVQIPACTNDLILYVYGKNNSIFTQLKCNSQDYFMYQRLKPDLTNNLIRIEETKELEFMLNSSELIGQFSSVNPNKSAIQCMVRVYNEEGILLSSVMSDSLGNFRFNNLSSENTYKFTADSNEALQLTLYNRYGKEIAKIQEEENSYFIFRPLGFQTNSDLSLMDDKVKFDLNLSEKYDAVIVYFNTNEAHVLNNDIEKLNTIYKLMKRYPQLKLSISAYADATASDEYNFQLSQKRGDWIAANLAAKGIEKNRFTVNAYGETKLIDPENDAVNRRAELRIYQ
ncbi:MAG: outer membrane protein OmpA-like peptidoglycan-associated protein [Crocinitomix sp.]|jgi:outer membrane protein OmpA-like peptidoglycan-associated protein